MSEIHEGDAVRIRDAAGEWHDATADSSIEPTHIDGRRVHDLPVVWVRSDLWQGRMPWPVEYVAVVLGEDTRP